MTQYIDAKPQHLQPQHGGRGDTATMRTLRRQPQLAEHQHIAQRHQQQQSGETEIHRRPGQRQTFGQAAQREIAGQCGRTPADRLQKALHVKTQARGHTDQIDQRRRMTHGKPQQYTHAQREPQRLAKHRADFVPAAGTVKLGHRRRHRHHHADAADDRQRPDAGADRHRTKHVRTDMSRQHRIDHIAADRRQLGQNQRQREMDGGTHFVRQAGTFGAKRFHRHSRLQGWPFYLSHWSRLPPHRVRRSPAAPHWNLP